MLPNETNLPLYEILQVDSTRGAIDASMDVIIMLCRRQEDCSMMLITQGPSDPMYRYQQMRERFKTIKLPTVTMAILIDDPIERRVAKELVPRLTFRYPITLNVFGGDQYRQAIHWLYPTCPQPLRIERYEAHAHPNARMRT